MFADRNQNDDRKSSDRNGSDKQEPKISWPALYQLAIASVVIHTGSHVEQPEPDYKPLVDDYPHFFAGEL